MNLIDNDIRESIEEAVKFLLDNGLSPVEVGDLDVGELADELIPIDDNDLLSLLESDLRSFGWDMIAPIIKEHAYEYICNRIYELFDEAMEGLGISRRWIIAELYYEIVDEFALDDLSIEVFEVQYYNKYNGDERAIWDAVERDLL